MQAIDKLHLDYPFYGSRKLAIALSLEGRPVNRKCVQRLMRLMNIESTAPKPTTSEPRREHAKYPYLLRKLRIDRVNQVWCADITYIPMATGFVYLVAIMDWHSRRVLAWRVSNTMETTFCIDALNEALSNFGQPEIFNTDQGSQFTAPDFTQPLLSRGIKISMDGKGRYLDNIFIERLWRSLKQEEVYLYAYDSVSEARASIGSYLLFYNNKRFHQSLGYLTPAAFYDHQAQQAA